MTDVSGLTDLNLCIIPAVSVLQQEREPRDCVRGKKKKNYKGKDGFLALQVASRS